MGEIVSAIPARCLWAEWDKDIYLDPPLAQFEIDGRQLQDALTQFSLEVEESDADGVRLLLEGPGLETRIQFKIAESPQSPTFLMMTPGSSWYLAAALKTSLTI